MRYAPSVRRKVERLRIAGFSIHSIAARLKIPISTAHWWIAGISQSSSAKRLTMENGRRAAKRKLMETLDRRLLGWQEEAETAWRKRGKDLFFGVGIGLYWGEGRKGDRVFKLTNSDPMVLKLWWRWCRRYFKDVRFHASVVAHLGVNAKSAERYWQKVLGVSWKIPVYFKKAITTGRGVGKLPYGTLSIQASWGCAKCFEQMSYWMKKSADIL